MKSTRNTSTSDMVLMTIATNACMTKTMWITNSAMSTHITNDDTGLYNTKNMKEAIQIGNGKEVYVTKSGKLKVSATSSDRTLMQHM